MFNIVTRQGSNAFRGDTNFYWQTEGLTGRNTDDEQDGGQPYNRDRFVDSTTQLGGPDHQGQAVVLRLVPVPAGLGVAARDRQGVPGQVEREALFLQVQLLRSTRTIACSSSSTTTSTRFPSAPHANKAPSSINLNHGHNPVAGAHVTRPCSIRRRWSRRGTPASTASAHDDPLNGGPRINTRFQDLDTGNITGGIYYWYDGKSFKTAFSGKVTKYADEFLGAQHDFKVGVQYNSGGGESVNGYNDYIYTYGSEPSYGYTQNPYWSGGRLRAFGVYVDDTIRLNRLTLNAGLRFDSSKGYFNSFPILDRNANEIGQSQAVDKLFDWNVISPRLGATFKLNDAGTTLIKGSWGRYYRGIVTGEFDPATPSIADRFAFSGTYDAQGNPLDLSLVTSNDNLRIDSGFENPYTDQYIVTFEHQLSDRVGFAVNGVWKKWDNQSAWRDIGGTYAPVTRTAEGKTFELLQLTSGAESRVIQLSNRDQMEATYKGAHFQMNKRMSNRWQGTVGLTLSRPRAGSGRALRASLQCPMATAPRAISADRTRTTSSIPTGCSSGTGRCCSSRRSSTSSAGT